MEKTGIAVMDQETKEKPEIKVPKDLLEGFFYNEAFGISAEEFAKLARNCLFDENAFGSMQLFVETIGELRERMGF